MEESSDDNKILLPHHLQQPLCEMRLPYRQGRKLTSVKVYSISKESNHLLIFGVPSLKLRQETKLLFMRFGKLIQFNISTDHAAEPFTETYHAQFERIQAARLAKRTLDTKSFYGGSLHVCYAPELESIDETQQKLIQRQKDVLFRLKYLQNEEIRLKNEVNAQKEIDKDSISQDMTVHCESDKNLLNMGNVNVIVAGNGMRIKRKISNNVVIEKKFKPCFVNQDCNDTVDDVAVDNDASVSSNIKRNVSDVPEIEIVDCTSVEKTTISNINEALNYNKFGEEIVFKLPTKPVNKIRFIVNKKSLIYLLFYLKSIHVKQSHLQLHYVCML